MSSLKRVANGYVSGILEPVEIEDLFNELKHVNKRLVSDFDFLVKGFGAVEAVPILRKLAGSDFKAFVEGNYNNGTSTLSHLFKAVVCYLNGKIAYQSVHSLVSIEQARFESDEEVFTPVASINEPLFKDGERVEDFDLYRLIAGIGLIRTVQLFLLLGGRSVNV